MRVEAGWPYERRIRAFRLVADEVRRRPALRLLSVREMPASSDWRGATLVVHVVGSGKGITDTLAAGSIAMFEVELHGERGVEAMVDQIAREVYKYAVANASELLVRDR